MRWLVRCGGAVLRGLWIALRALALGGLALARAVARHPRVRAACAWLWRMLRRAARGAARRGRQTSDWLYRWIGRPVTYGLSGLAFAGFALLPDLGPLYRGIDWNRDLDCMALNIYPEARGEPREGKLAVGYVVMNRVFDPRFPGTVCAVVTQGGEERRHRCQFSWWCDGRDDWPRDQRALNESYDLASRIFAGRAADPTGGALWYHATYVDPRWRKSMVEGPTIGQHRFYLGPQKR